MLRPSLPAKPLHAGLEVLGVLLLSLLAYAALLSELPVDDVAGYVKDLQADRPVWDIAHLWVQPLALYVHRLLSPALSTLAVLELLNISSCAIAMSVFFRTLRVQGLELSRSLLGVLLVGVSFNLLSLGPTAHIKLLVFPFLALALHEGVRWERALAGGAAPLNPHLLAAGAWLGLAATLLVSVLPMGPFIALLVFCAARRRGASVTDAARALAGYLVAMGLAGLISLYTAYGLALLTDSTQRGPIEFVLGGVSDKDSLHIGFFGFVEIPLRIIYSLVYNFVFLPDLGALGRAALYGLLPDITPLLPGLLRDLAVAGLSLAALLSILGFSLRAALRGTGLLLPFGAVAGAVAFAAYWNLNDPEHWFQLTLPLVLLALCNTPERIVRGVLYVWLPVLLIVNLGLYGVPKARFDVAWSTAEITRAVGPGGLYIGYAGYPGEPDASVLPLSRLDRVRLDNLFREQGSADATLAVLTARIDAALARGGNVIVFRVLDETDWRGPILGLSMTGLPRRELLDALHARYRISETIRVGGFPARRIEGLK